MVFGRCFENALGAYFKQQDCTLALFKEWDAFRDTPFAYRKGDSWDRLLHQGVHLLEMFVRDERIRVRRPNENLQRKITQPLSGGNEFVSYIDAIGELDGKRCLIDWKTTTSRYRKVPKGFSRLIHSSFVILGSAAFQMWLSSCSSASNYLRSNT